jgi:hypothetical protein
MMIEITLTVEMYGKQYQTNVIARKGTIKEDIIRLAEEQVKKQWLL